MGQNFNNEDRDNCVNTLRDETIKLHLINLDSSLVCVYNIGDITYINSKYISHQQNLTAPLSLLEGGSEIQDGALKCTSFN